VLENRVMTATIEHQAGFELGVCLQSL